MPCNVTLGVGAARPAGIPANRRRSWRGEVQRSSRGWPGFGLRWLGRLRRLRRASSAAPSGASRWSAHSGELSTRARKRVAPPAPVGARGGAGQVGRLRKARRRELDTGGSLAVRRWAKGWNRHARARRSSAALYRRLPLASRWRDQWESDCGTAAGFGRCAWQGEGTDGPAGNSGCGRTANAGAPRGGGGLPEGSGARTGGRGPASVRAYGCVPRYGGAARAGTLERGSAFRLWVIPGSHIRQRKTLKTWIKVTQSDYTKVVDLTTLYNFYKGS
jgi:hypothetical protein